MVDHARGDREPTTSAQPITLHGAELMIAGGLLDDFGSAVRALRDLRERRLAIISDDVVAPLYAFRIQDACTMAGAPRPLLFTIPAGETSKTREQWARLTDSLLAAGFGRDSAVVALGGGVVGDLAGFVAATFMRGIPVVQVPTTLLAMVDASIGGKTGVDTSEGKNLVGAFHQPTLVLADPRTLRTLSARQFRNGLAEAIKHGVIASSREFDWLVSNLAAVVRRDEQGERATDDLVTRNIEIKANIVARDEREGGLRRILNFGHTVGHALETCSAYSMQHGECVAIGMLVEARIASRLGVCARELTEQIASAVAEAGLPTVLPPTVAPTALLAATRMDKKGRAGSVEYALPTRIGEMAGADRGYSIPVPDDVVLEALAMSRA